MERTFQFSPFLYKDIKIYYERRVESERKDIIIKIDRERDR